jgi:signal transduction histidine kinase
VGLLGLVILLVSGLTYTVGGMFARQALTPAEEAMLRLEQFTQDASHELRTPLAAVSSSLDLALRTGDHEVNILAAKHELARSSDLVERLLELARLDRTALRLETVDVSALVAEEAAAIEEAAASRGLQLDTRMSPAVRITGDGMLLHRVVANLLANAVKYSAEDKPVVVTVERKGISVTNWGSTLSEADLPHVFDAFYQADASRSGDGLGLGLAIVRKIADIHGWDVRVRSDEQDGTTFTIDFAGRHR